MPYQQAAEQRQELPSRSIPRRRRPAFVPSRSMSRRCRPEFVPAGCVHAIDTDTREVACGINAAGLYVFDRDWASGIGMDWCPACLEATGYGRPLEPPPGPTTP
jgi:hypothetical protein